jgi:nitroreductase
LFVATAALERAKGALHTRAPFTISSWGHLLLAARGLNLGATLTTLHKMHDADVKTLLGIPEKIETIALIPIGYPKGKYGPTVRKPVEEIVHYERWNPSLKSTGSS